MHAAYLFVKVVGWRRGRLSCSCIIKYKEYVYEARKQCIPSINVYIYTQDI